MVAKTIEEWKAAYKARFIENGISENGAQLEVDILEFDGLHFDILKDDPVQAADECMAGWVDDVD